MKTRLMKQSIAFMLLIAKSNQNASTAYKLGCVVHLDSFNVFMSSENSILCLRLTLSLPHFPKRFFFNRLTKFFVLRCYFWPKFAIKALFHIAATF